MRIQVRLFLPILAVLALTSAGNAQTTKGRIVGTVTDTSGSVVSGVQVTARGVDTGAAFTAMTSDAGAFVFPDLQIGRWEVAAEIQGFKSFRQGPFDLLVDQTVRIDIKLQVGNVSESITVDGGAPLIQTDQSSIGQVVENKTVVELPLNGRNFVRLGSLMPGTTQGSPGDGGRRTRQQGELLTANGQRAEHNNYMLDGAENNSAIEGVAVIIPSIDAIQEFKVQTSNYSAEFGRANGAVVNLAIKSGTNQFHGTAFEFLRNDAFDARDFFDVGVTPLRRNQFGFSLGGPVVKDRVFFFGNYEGLRERRANTRGFLVPETAWRSGNFAGQPTVYDPLDTDAAGNRRPFANNVIPTARLSPISQKLNAYWPTANNPGDRARNYLENFNNPVGQNQIHIRGDVRLSDKDQLMARISKASLEDLNNSIAFGGQYNNFKPQSGVIGWTRALSPTMVNEARFSAYMFNFELLPDTQGRNFTAEFGLPSFASSEELQQFPQIVVRSLTGLGAASTMPLYRKEINYQWIEQFTWIRGKQTLKMGVDVRRYQTNNYQPQTSAGNYTFNGPFTGVRNGQYTTGYPDFLLGLPQRQQILDPSTYDAQRLRNTRLNMYVQDDISVTQRLTLNLGLRWERDGAWTEANNRWAYFDYATGQVVYPNTLQFPFTFPFPHRFDNITSMKAPTNRAFAPRAGFALRPFGDNRTVVRGGYGISWGQPLVFVMLNSALTPPPFLLRTDLVSSNATPQLQFGVFPGGGSGAFIPQNPSFFTHQPGNFSNGYVQQWNLGVEREILGQIAARISYVGAKGTHLERRYEGNAALPPGPGNVNARRRFPIFRGVTQQESSASSSYQSLQVSGEKRFAKGLMFLSGYTWGKSLDDASSWNPNGDSAHIAQNPADLKAEKGRSAFDVRHRFTLSSVYNLPFTSTNPIAKQIVGGWQLSGILTLQTGFPTTPNVGGDIPNAATGTTRASINGPGNLPSSERTLDRWFNTAAFSRPDPFTFGTAGRTILDRPGQRLLDFSVMKLFSITEQHRLQFRAEFFNFPNHPNFGSPGLNVDNPATFGVIRSGGTGREVQLALKYIF